MRKIESSISELINKFNLALAKFQKHQYTTYHQFNIVDLIRKNISDAEAYIVLDFSQNYICKYHEEIQAIHFGASKKQISLQTGVAYFNDEHFSFTSLSDCLCHEAPAVWALLIPVLKEVFRNRPNIKTIHFQSDGTTAQYKNKNNFYLLTLYSKKFRLNSVT